LYKNVNNMEYWARSNAGPAQPEIEIKE